VYQPWASRLDAGFDLRAVQLPGRQDRYEEDFALSLDGLVGRLAAAVAEDAADLPLVLLGHSMGALLAFATAQILIEQHGRRPEALVLSGCNCPDSIAPLAVHGLDDADLLQAVIRLGGIPKELADHPEFLNIMLPIIRADLTLVSKVHQWAWRPVDVLLDIVAGTEDSMTSVENLKLWDRLSTAGVRLHMRPGGHFFLWDESDYLLGLVGDVKNAETYT